MDTVEARREELGREKDPQLLQRAEVLWNNMEEIREEGARAYRFTYGDQWGDEIVVNGERMTQRTYLQKQGNIALQTNQMKNKVDTIAGILVKERNEPVCNAIDRDEQQYGELMTSALQANCNKNDMEALYQINIVDLNLIGLAGLHECYEYRNGRLDSWTDYVDPNCLFFDSELRDPRFRDLTLIGQFFDREFEYVASRFAKNERDYDLLRQVYPNQSRTVRFNDEISLDTRMDADRLTFRSPADSSKCRVFEIWTKESKPRYRVHDNNEGTLEIINADDREALEEIKITNATRRALAAQAGWAEDEVPDIETEFFIDEYWYCRYLAPDGTILWEGESPYADREHPFTIVATPFAGGKIVGYMHDGIDHNIAINRAIVLHDWLVRAQAKGVTVVPKALVPDDMTYEDFAYSWTSIDDIVYIDTKPGVPMPEVFHGAAQTFDVSTLINTYSNLMENSTAVNGALQGKTPYSGTSGSLYAQMAANSSTPIAALMSKFRDFMMSVSKKKMKNIAAFYDPKRFEDIAGSLDGIFDNSNLHLNDVADIEFDLAIKASTETPVYRAIINDDAKEFLLRGIITWEEYLQIADVPYGPKMLQIRQAREAEMAAAQGAMPAGQEVGNAEGPATSGQGEAPGGEGNGYPYHRAITRQEIESLS